VTAEAYRLSESEQTVKHVCKKGKYNSDNLTP
jgi:hypothetical protein